MAHTAISYGTAAWLASLIDAGWKLGVVHHFIPGEHVVLRLVEDDFDELELKAPDLRTVGVLAEKGGDGVFIPCSDREAATDLLNLAYREYAAN